MTQAERSLWKARKGLPCVLTDGREATVTGIRVEPWCYKHDRVALRFPDGTTGFVDPGQVARVGVGEQGDGPWMKS